MATINEHYTFQYVQPDSYRFSHDSVFLAREVFEREKTHLNEHSSILDLCAGCGIVGLDFLFHLKKEMGLEPKRCDFLEVQEIYHKHFTENADRFGRSATTLEFFNQNFAGFTPQYGYDLILCNPPYFQPGSGKLSPDEFKNRCRFFLDASEAELWLAVERLLKPEGRAYVLAREFASECLPIGLRGEVVGDIRGTALVQLRRAVWV